MQHNATPLVSVVVPTYNRADLLRLTIESVLGQTYPAVELIVVDDGSSDGTPALLDEYAGRLTAIRQQNQGGAAAANRGFEASSGELVTFLDHDDLMYPDKLARQVQAMQAMPDVAVCNCRFDTIDEHGKRIRSAKPLPDSDVVQHLLEYNFIWSGGPLIRRETLLRVGLHDEANWCADWDMWLRIALAGDRFHCVQSVLGAYRVVTTSQMSNVARVEQHCERLLRNAFKSGHLPAGVAAMEPRSLSHFKWYVAGLYTNAGQPAEASRALAEAIRIDPSFIADPAKVCQWLCVGAFDVRVSDPMAFIDSVFAHLPEEAAPIKPLYNRAKACALLGRAMCQHAAGDAVGKQQFLQDALIADPALPHEPDLYVDFVISMASDLPADDPAKLLAGFFRHTPREYGGLKRKVMGRINLDRAFESYFAGHRADTVRQTLRAVVHQPDALKNRGVLSILARSCLPLPAGH